MPTPQQARVNPAANVPPANQRRTNRALVQGLDALPFFAESEAQVRFPASSNFTSTAAATPLFNAAALEVEIEKFESWTDLVIDYTGSGVAPATAVALFITFDLIEKESGTVVLADSPLGRVAIPPSVHGPAWGHTRLAGINPGVYIIRLLWKLGAALQVNYDANDQQLLTAVEALPRPQPTFIASED